MKRIVVYSLISILFSSCSHRIVRSGYKMQENLNNDCEVVIEKNISIPDTVAIKVGEIKLGESGFSMACSEEAALETLKKEACSIDADLILITKEKRPDFWSSCYRCNADFYKFSKLDFKENYKSNPTYDTNQIKNRVKSDRGKNVFMAITAAFAGILAGTLLF